MTKQYLSHHGILGQKWGIRRYQNKDGTLTDEGRKRLDQKDSKWAHKNYQKIYNRARQASEKEMNRYTKEELNPKYYEQTKRTGKVSKSYINEYNQKLSQLMSSKVSDLRAPSGKVIKFVAKRGEVGVHMALADSGYDMNQLKNGVWSSGKIAYKKKNVDIA